MTDASVSHALTQGGDTDGRPQADIGSDSDAGLADVPQAHGVKQSSELPLQPPHSLGLNVFCRWPSALALRDKENAVRIFAGLGIFQFWRILQRRSFIGWWLSVTPVSTVSCTTSLIGCYRCSCTHRAKIGLEIRLSTEK